MALFAQKGVSRTTIQEIADSVSIGKGTIYEYFNSKEEILVASFHYMQEEAESYLDKELQEDVQDPVELLKGFFEGFIRYLESIPDNVTKILLIFWAEAILQDPRADPADIYPALDLRAMYENYIHLISTIIESGIRQQYFHEHTDPAKVASALVGAADGLMLQWVLFKDRVDIRAIIDEFLEVVLYGIRRQD